MLADATAYLEATGHLVVAWLWLEQWLVADGKESAFYDGKRAATRYFFARELPKIGPHARPAGRRRPHHAGPRPRRPVTHRPVDGAAPQDEGVGSAQDEHSLTRR